MRQFGLRFSFSSLGSENRVRKLRAARLAPLYVFQGTLANNTPSTIDEELFDLCRKGIASLRRNSNVYHFPRQDSGTCKLSGPNHESRRRKRKFGTPRRSMIRQSMHTKSAHLPSPLAVITATLGLHSRTRMEPLTFNRREPAHFCGWYNPMNEIAVAKLAGWWY